VIDHFGRKVDNVVSNENENVSAQTVFQVIKSAPMGTEKLRTFPELRFSFEKEASPEDFFVPFVWSLIISSFSIPWKLSAITIFVPVMPKEVRNSPEQRQGGSGGGDARNEYEMQFHSAAENSSDTV